MNKEEIIKRYGKKDGNDEIRYCEAIRKSKEIDRPVFICFQGLVNLENKGLIKLSNN